MAKRHVTHLVECGPHQRANLERLLDNIIDTDGRVLSIVELTQRHPGALLVISQHDARKATDA